MTHKLINTGSYLLVVSDEEIKEGEYWCNVHPNSNYIDTKAPKESGRFAMNSNSCFENSKKIIAHLPLKNSRILQGVDLLPPFEQEDNYHYIDVGNVTDVESFIQGYNKAKEKYKYTEEDLNKAFFSGGNMKEIEEFNHFIQSLSQPKIPVAFNRHTEQVLVNGYKNQPENIIGFIADYETRFKTTTNSQGQTVWVGEYIYDNTSN